jgi:seryl-tRNA synthetase
MIDIKLLRENPQAIKDSIKRRGLKLDIDALLDLDTKRRAKIAELEGLQAKRNALASEVGKGKPTSEQVARGRELKSQHESIDGELKKLDLHFHELMAEVPNLIAEGTPDGGEESNKEIEKNGNTSKGFEVKDHMQLNELYGLYDFEAGAKVAGNKFYFTRHRAVKLWQSILMATQEIVEQEGFELVAVPHMVSTEVAEGTGYLPKGDEEQNYVDEKQGLVMIATSEIPLTGMHKDEILDLDEPLMYAGISPCYRLEAGAYIGLTSLKSWKCMFFASRKIVPQNFNKY